MPKASTQKNKVAAPASQARTAPAADAKAQAKVVSSGAASQKAEKKTLKSAAKADAAKTSAKPPAAEQPKEKLKKPKMVRDSFSMPENEYKVLGDVKRACLKAGIEIKKSEILRIGVELIRQTEVAKLKTMLSALTPLKVGRRPKKEK